MYRKFFKRLLDILISGLALIILSPLFLILAIIVRINLGSPVIYKQVRVGQGGKLFMFYKFRSMRDAKDKNGNDLPDEVRCGKFGRILRATSLDELPQLWNIFKGDMSLIGPRPQMIVNEIFFVKDRQISYGVKPGITGYSQVYGRNNVSWTRRMKNDIYYAKNLSFWLDVKIFFKTIAVVFEHSNIEKEQYMRYSDEMLDKGLISKGEHDAYLLKARELEARCGMGEKLNIKDYALNNVRDVAIPAEIIPYKKDEKSA